MKRIICLLLVLFLCSGCNIDKNIIRTGDGAVVLVYSSHPVFSSSENSNEYNITLYDDKTLSVSNYGKMSKKINVSDEDYQKIINYAFSSKFVNLKKDLTDDRVLDGSYNSIELYFEDGTSKKYGGYNPTNKTFLKLRDMLIKVLEKEGEQ